MQIKLIGAIDYEKLKEELKSRNLPEELLQVVKKLEKRRHSDIVATSGRLSRYIGDVFEILGVTEDNTLEKNIKFIERVISMGHDSTTDHDYFVFALKDVSIMLEQEIIKERYSSFTIKSRREVDFKNAGIYVPDFHDYDGNLLKENASLKGEYTKHMSDLFEDYEFFKNNGIKNEDARFIMPYCTNSNIIMGVDAHTLRDMIVKFTKTKYSKVQELREFGENLRKIIEEYAPYLIVTIDSKKTELTDQVYDYLISKLDDNKPSYQVINETNLLTRTNNIDDTILISSLMRHFQLDKNRASQVYSELCQENPNFKKELMRKIAFEGDGEELSQVNFEFQIPISYAVLTHLTRHRTHKIMIPDIFSGIDLKQYKIPPKIANKYLDYYKTIHDRNFDMYNHFKNDYSVCNEDLIYFTLCGNKINVVTNMDGKTVKHILSLRECNKSQWETRGVAYGIHKEIKKLEDAQIFSSILGPTCVTQDICNEKKECCGKILQLRKKMNQK